VNDAWLDDPVLAIAPVVVLTAAFLGSLVVFALRAALRGHTATARVEKLGGSILLSKFIMDFGLWAFGPVIRTGVRLGIHPDVFTWSSLVLHLVAAVLLARGHFGPGGWALVLGSFCDAIDGAVARARGLSSDAGEVLDAAIDRWAEMAAFFGLAWYYRELWWGFVLAVAACAGAIMVSYSRAKAEGFGIDAKGGLMQRHERGAWLCTATVFSGIWEAWHPSAGFARHGLVLFALAAIALLANWTGWSRTAFTRRELRRR
jgi:CDP-diacylglycerol--glycerol-3-phosphate 3-phosphatidyltransferase